MVISWSYDIFYNWYRKQLKYIDEDVGVGIKDPVLAIVYESKRPKKKDINTLEPFVKPNIKYAGVSPIQDPVNYPNGLYLLMEADPGAIQKKYIFVVFPTISECPTPTMVGNHHTFVLDTNDTNTPCHFHSSYYTCQKIGSVYAWLDPHYKDYFSTTLELPKQGSNEVTDAIIKHPINKQHKHTILDIMRYPWKSGTSGGAKPRSASRAQASTHIYVARNIQSVAFSTLWLEREYRAMYAMGIVQQNTGNVQWSVRIVRKGRDRVQLAYVFVTQSADETLFQTTLVQLILQNEPDVN